MYYVYFTHEVLLYPMFIISMQFFYPCSSGADIPSIKLLGSRKIEEAQVSLEYYLFPL